MQKTKIMFLCMLMVLLATQELYSIARPPKLTILIVVDQLAHHYIAKLYPHLRGGLKYLLTNGFVFNNGYHQHGLPYTGTGHATLNTGVYAQDHGIIGNNWCAQEGDLVHCDEDCSLEAAVISPEDGSTYDYSRSAHHVMVDGLTEQYVMQSKPDSIFRAVSISFKDYPAVITANKLGKPIWFDNKSGRFTSSKAYFDVLPEWLQKFNETKTPHLLETVTWNRLYPKKKYAYNFFDISYYDHSIVQKSIVDTTVEVKSDFDPKNPYYWYERTPHANQLLIDLTRACIHEHVSKRSHDRLLIWLCISSLDLIGHDFGPDSLEAIDMIYHLDKQLTQLLRSAMTAVGKSNLLVALTADHGVCQISELLQTKGMNSCRINPLDIINTINTSIAEKYGIEECVIAHAGNHLYLNIPVIETLDAFRQYACIKDIKKAAHVQGIKRVWTFDELYNLCTQNNSFEDNLRKQLFPGRSGDIILQTYPYALLTDHTIGTSHGTVYGYDTRVPIIIFQPYAFESRVVRERVSTVQFASTIAEILGIPHPSASTADILPGLYDWQLR